MLAVGVEGVSLCDQDGFIAHLHNATTALACQHLENTAHKVGQNLADVLVNLDCSRILGSEFLPKLLRLPFKLHPDDTSSEYVGGHFASTSVSGSYGTVIIVAWLFIALNGYDEEFYPWGFQDTDLLLRLKTQGKVHVISDPDSVGDDIPNAEGAYKDHIKAKMTSIDYDKYGNMKWGNMDQKNRADGQEKLRRGQAVRNYKKIIGGSVVQVLCTDMPEEDDDEDTGEADWSE